jgi:hypothetical protein
MPDYRQIDLDNAPFYRAKVVIFPRAKPLAASDRRGKRPTAYAPGFGVAGAHLSRHRSPGRPKKERPAPNFQGREERQRGSKPLTIMRHNSKPDIRLEVPERLRIYLMSDVISQHSASLDFAFVSAQMGTEERGPAYIPQLRDYAVAKQRTESRRPATVATAIRTGQAAGGGRKDRRLVAVEE